MQNFRDYWTIPLATLSYFCCMFAAIFLDYPFNLIVWFVLTFIYAFIVWLLLGD